MGMLPLIGAMEPLGVAESSAKPAAAEPDPDPDA
jgi:hypothetical protein